ncbi:MAG: hypothetical protein JXK93_13740 [Sphaerochaetaceae bacterium]|nr:hypothetical protein [Sphaerochaetaceae bacterium]
MIQVKNTDQLAGVTICGDYRELYELVEALHDIVVHDWDEPDAFHARYITVSLRILGIAYDIRHAYQGDRELILVDNGVGDHPGEHLDSSLPQKNVAFCCNIPYPEIIAATMILNDLIKLRADDKRPARERYNPYHKEIIWDTSVLLVRQLQAGLQSAVAEVLTGTSYTRWINLVTPDSMLLSDIVTIPGVFIDTWNIRYLRMNREQRAKKLLTVTKRFAEHAWDDEARAFRAAVDSAKEEYGCAEGDLRWKDISYPEDIEW